MDREKSSVKEREKRPYLKSHPGGFNNYQAWKDKLRENCYKRVRDNRTHLLWKMRRLCSNSTTDCNSLQNRHESFVRSAFRDIVSDELKNIKSSSPDDHCKMFHDAAVNDSLWVYDGLPKAYQGECEEILLEMQKIFYEDLLEEPTSTERQTASWVDEEDEYLAEAVYKHMQLEDKQVYNKEMWCPICKRGQLLENPRIIYCTLCELKLTKSYEVDLDLLRDRLAEAHTEHLDRGCRLKPKFCVETKFGLTALYIICEPCCTFEVVL